MPRLNPFAFLGRTRLTRLWHVNLGEHIVGVSYSEAHQAIAAAGAEGALALLDPGTGQTQTRLAGHDFGVSSIAWSSDGRTLASAGQDGKVKLWHPHQTSPHVSADAGAAWVERVVWHPLAGQVVSCAGKKIRLWDAQGNLLREFPEQASTVADARWKPGESLLASTCYGKLALWNPYQQDPVGEFEWQGSMLVLAWSPDGKYIAAGGQDCTVHFWELKTGEDLQMSGYPRKVRELAWSANSRYLATGGGETVCVWDFSGKGPEGTRPLQFDAHKAALSALAFQNQGTLLASGGEDGLVSLWNPGKQSGPLARAELDAGVSQMLWLPNDQHLAVGAEDGSVLFFEVK